MDFPIKISQLKSPQDHRELLDRLIKTRAPVKQRNSNPRTQAESDSQHELRQENLALRSKIEQLHLRIRELEAQLEQPNRDRIQEETLHPQFQHSPKLSPEEESLRLALQLQEQENCEFQNRLRLMENQVDPDQMTYEELQELEEKMGFVSRGLDRSKIQKILNECRFKEECNECCTICLEEGENPVEIQLGCHHVFHAGCIEEWLQREKHCPVCKREIDSS